MRVIGLIPARMESTRLAGKALKLIGGLPMIVHVYLRAKISKELDIVSVCTDSTEIEAVCRNFSIPCILTGSHHINGTERCGEAALTFDLRDDDIVIDIQGDEPLIDPIHIDQVCIAAKSLDAQIILPHLEISKSDLNIVKVVYSEIDSKVLYLSRAEVPYSFRHESALKKHLSIISFTMGALRKYCDTKATTLELIEGIELLRALEIGLHVKTIKLSGESRAVDVLDDLVHVQKIMPLDPCYQIYKKIFDEKN